MSDGPSRRETPDELNRLAGVDPAAPRTPACRSEDEIALLLFADGGDDAAAFLNHAASCDYCGPLVEAAVHASDGVDDEDDALVRQLKTAAPDWQRQMAWRFAGAQQAQRPRPSRWWIAAAAAVAAAAVIVFAVRLDMPLWRGSSSRPELQELVAAVGADPTRPLEGRLTGGFAYAPPPTLQRGPGDQASPRVRIAEAKLEEASRASDTPDTQAALGAGLLAVGSIDKGIDALEEAVQQKPGDARFQNDLAAAYLARAKWSDRAEDWPRALAAAERAIKADPKLAEAYFNRALALEGLHLDEQAAEAWQSYQAIEPSPKWKTEAAERAQKLKQRSSVDLPRGNQEAREHIEDVLLTQWGEALLAGDRPGAAKILDEAERAATALAAAGGDTMARDEIALIRHAQSVGRPADLMDFAEGHVAYGHARTQFVSDRLAAAADLMLDASRHLVTVSSAYRMWAPIYKSIALRIGGAPQSALDELKRASIDHLPQTYYHMRGRYDWTQGVVLNALERVDLGRLKLERTVEVFRTGGELEQLSAASTLLAETEWFLGDREAAWSLQLPALAASKALRANRRRTDIFVRAAYFALGEGLPEVALHFDDAALRSSSGAYPSWRADAVYLQRADALGRLGRRSQALDDLRRAEDAIQALSDAGLRELMGADVKILRARLADGVDDRRAVEDANEALEYVRHSDPTVRLGTLLMQRAKGREALGDNEGAASDLGAAIDAFERKRSSLKSVKDRIQAFEPERAAYGDLVKFFSVVRNDQAEALRLAERGRTGAVSDRMRDERGVRDGLASIYGAVPPNVAVVYFATLSDRVLCWIITREAQHYFTAPMPLKEIEVLAARSLRSIGADANLAQLRLVLQPLQDQLIEPALRFAANKSTVIFVPDGPLISIPFAALPDSRGRPLIARYAVGVAPSLDGLVAASTRLADFRAEDVLAVGDGHDPGVVSLPRLPRADDEAEEIGALYPSRTVLTGRAATKRHFFQQDHAVVHFSGHTIVNLPFPVFSRLLLAPDVENEDGGSLLTTEIYAHAFAKTQVVVLASCQGAAGKVMAGEGALSVARAFFDAGVPAVVASLWPMDEAAHSLLVGFHRELRAHHDPASALRATQLAWLEEHGSGSPVRLWGGFETLGGVVSPTH